MSSISSPGDIPPLGLIMILERGQVFMLPTDYAFKICLPAKLKNQTKFDKMESHNGLAIFKASRDRAERSSYGKWPVPWDWPFCKCLETGLKGQVMGSGQAHGTGHFDFYKMARPIALCWYPNVKWEIRDFHHSTHFFAV